MAPSPSHAFFPEAGKRAASLAFTGGLSFASLFLAALVFTVAMTWNSAIQSCIDYLAPPPDKVHSKRQVLLFNILAALILTCVVLALTFAFQAMYGSRLRTMTEALYAAVAAPAPVVPPIPV